MKVGRSEGVERVVVEVGADGNSSKILANSF